jgi:hypothetical protein
MRREALGYVFLCLSFLGYGFLLVYGCVSAKRQRILANRRRPPEYLEGKAAVRRARAYIAIGLLGLIVSLLAVLRPAE